MLKTAFLTLVALAIAIAGGAMSVRFALETFNGAGSVTIGAWTTFPDFATPAANPYSRARFAREGGLSLGQAEGISFTAIHDSAGMALRRDCAYRVSGAVPPARFWTLHATDDGGHVLPGAGRRMPALQSLMLLRRSDAPLAIQVGAKPAPGNWLAVSGKGSMRLVLTLFDTPISGEKGVTDIALPNIARMRCDG